MLDGRKDELLDFDFEEPDDDTAALLRRTTNAEQEDVDDAAADAVLTGAYDEAPVEEELDVMMDAEEDLADEEDVEDLENTYAKAILDQCQGLDDEGKPKASIAIALSMENPLNDTMKTLAQAAFCSAPLSINSRHRFIEVVLTFPTPASNDMRVLWNHLEKYGSLLNKQEAEDEEIPSMKVYIVPHSSLGTCFISGIDPVFWSLCSQKPGTVADQLRILFDAEYVDFFETDEIDLTDIDTEAQRMIENSAEAYAAAEEYEQARREEDARNYATIEALRKGGLL